MEMEGLSPDNVAEETESMTRYAQQKLLGRKQYITKYTLFFPFPLKLKLRCFANDFRRSHVHRMEEHPTQEEMQRGNASSVSIYFFHLLSLVFHVLKTGFLYFNHVVTYLTQVSSPQQTTFQEIYLHKINNCEATLGKILEAMKVKN